MGVRRVRFEFSSVPVKTKLSFGKDIFSLLYSMMEIVLSDGDVTKDDAFHIEVVQVKIETMT
jgi:hypothetical protein